MNFFRKKPPLNQRSQIAVIITFVIAVIFLFIAVFINLAKVSQVKTTTSTAADKAALSLASQLGSMSRYYKDKVLKISGPCVSPAPCKKCGPGWIELGLVVLATSVIALFLTPVSAIAASSVLLSGATFTAYLSTSMLGGIDNKFNEMSLYSSLREKTLFQALISTQTDDVEYKAKTEGSGIFYEDTNDNGVFDAGEPEYDLRDVPGMLNEKKVNRFLVWYYKKRLPLVSDDGIKLALDTFINGTSLVPGLKDFTDTDEWSATEWKIKQLSYILKQLPTLGGPSDYEITCNMAAPDKCPDWVKAKTPEEILRMVQIDASDNAYGGFLKDKLVSLLNRLEDKYNGTFCAGTSCKIKPDDVNNLIEDLRRFLAGCEDVFNMPVSERLRNITQWFPIFYDSIRHNPADKTSIDGKDDYDIYLRLARDQDKIYTWFTELETLNNNTIAPDIKKKHGECTWGRGPSVSSTCYTQYGCSTSECGCHCCGSDCSGCCCNTCCYPSSQKSPCAWEGTYYTCCQNPPVCSSGDLYAANPGWCSSRGDRAGCHSNCGCSVQTFNCGDDAKSFQGQLAYNNTSGPTEVEQATRILRALKDDLATIQRIIGDLANTIAEQLPSQPYEPYIDANGNGAYDDGETFEDLNGDKKYTADLSDYYKRNKIVYAWQDKSKFSHLVSAAIDGYPKQLPHITESSFWDTITKTCRTLEDYAGDFTITTWRYDQDQPTDIAGWNLRRRRQGSLEGGKEVPPDILAGIVTDVQDNGKIDSKVNEDYIKVRLLPEYAITSCSTAHYGSEKSDIKITKTEGD